MIKSKVKIDTNKLKKTIMDKAEQTLQDRNYDVKCPHCNSIVSVPTGRSLCPHCHNEINLTLNIEM